MPLRPPRLPLPRRSGFGAWLCGLALVACPVATAHGQLATNSLPGPAYFGAIERLYEGEYRDAERGFANELRGAVKTVNARWLDSLCFHAMLGETYYQWGRLDQALEQFNLACDLHLQYPKWLLRVNFQSEPRPDGSQGRLAVPWGVSQRGATIGYLPPSWLISIGSVDNSEQVRSGGVVTQAQYWQLNGAEVLRATALAIRRRNELLGPLGPHDSLSKRLVTALSRGAAPPNHWSQAYVSVLSGLALSGVGEDEQALAALQQGVTLAGRYDHALTGVALLEQGRLQMLAGAGPAADPYFAEASYAAFYFNDFGVIDDATRWFVANRLASGIDEANAPLAALAAWARRNRLDHVASRAQLCLADELLATRRGKEAAAAWQAGQQRMRDAAQGVLGTYALFLGARIDLLSGRDTALAQLATAVERQAAMSPRNFQIGLANRMFDAQTLPARTAGDVYRQLLDDPQPGDAAFRLLDMLAVIRTPHRAAFSRWLTAALERDDWRAAMDVVDRATRRRFHQALPWAGRLSAVRRLAAAPLQELTAEERTARGALLVRWPELDRALAAADAATTALQRQWQPADDKEALASQAGLWRDLRQTLDVRERLLAAVALERTHANFAFPPPLAENWQRKIPPGEAALVFHDTPNGVLALLFTADDAVAWNCGSSAELATLVADLLRALGNSDGNREQSVESLASDAWQIPAAALYDALLGPAPLDLSSLEELAIVPDGVLWYVPFEALCVVSDSGTGPLHQFTRLRHAPTLGLAYRFQPPWRRVQRTVIAPGSLVPGDKEEQRMAALQPLLDAVENPIALPPAPPTSGPMAAQLTDALVSLEEIELAPEDPFAWSPLAIDRAAARESLANWLALPGVGPQRVVLPGVRTLAERGGKASRRRANDAAAPGDELFLATATLMASGAETILISRWRVGGQSTLDFVREFLQEAPYTRAADAWQRCVDLAAEWPLDPLNEPRIKAPPQGAALTAGHPFFWAGYLLVDSGWTGPPPPAPPAEEGAAAAAPAAEGEAEPDAKPAEPDAKPAAAADAADAKVPSPAAGGPSQPPQPAEDGSAAEQPAAADAPEAAAGDAAPDTR